MTVPARVPRPMAMTNDAMVPAEISAVAPKTADQPRMAAGALSAAIEPGERDSAQRHCVG